MVELRPVRQQSGFTHSGSLLLRTRTQAYLEKRLGADFYKVPRATAVRILSAVRESIVWILKQVLCHKASAPHGENQAPCAPMLGV